MPAPKDQLYRCVRSVTLQGMKRGLSSHEAFSRAYGICKGSLLNSGFLDPESYRSEEPTPAGLRRIAEMRKQPDHLDKLAEYQTLKIAARKRPVVQRRMTLQQMRAALGLPVPPRPTLQQMRAVLGLSVPPRPTLQQMRAAIGLTTPSPLEQALTGSANRSVPWLKRKVGKLRDAMDPVFSCETVFGDCKWPEYPSAGHCFMAALAVQDILGGKILYGAVNNIHHYWNKVGAFSVDITADQFNQPRIIVKKGSIRPSESEFDRGRYKRGNRENKEVMKIYDRFRVRLIQELKTRGLTDYVSHLERMP